MSLNLAMSPANEPRKYLCSTRPTTARVCKIYQRQVLDGDLGKPRISSCQLRGYLVISIVDAASLPFIKRNVSQR